MEQNNIYNLKPIKWVLLGLVISTILPMGMIHFDISLAYNYILIAVFQIAGWIITTLELRKLREYSKFNRCYGFAKWLIVLIILGIHLITIPLIIAFLYYIFKSIEEIALHVGEEKLAKIANNIFMVSAWTIIIDVFVIPFVGALFSVEEIVMNIAIKVPEIVCIVMYGFIYKVYKILDGREIPIEFDTCNDVSLD